ncbi:hypothetical protein DPEC_G00055900 [Dallia pectoralis]|uniref:Uncharacterized protein n=1 Tax=Dallia pectoralis TaxID=75939 RepID=A0ACC2H611_DALPE|nr:hypothetical protein DPEC_G00055900 [Dallia pectoralis]
MPSKLISNPWTLRPNTPLCNRDLDLLWVVREDRTTSDLDLYTGVPQGIIKSAKDILVVGQTSDEDDKQPKPKKMDDYTAAVPQSRTGLIPAVRGAKERGNIAHHRHILHSHILWGEKDKPASSKTSRAS